MCQAAGACPRVSIRLPGLKLIGNYRELFAMVIATVRFFNLKGNWMNIVDYLRKRSRRDQQTRGANNAVAGKHLGV